MFWEAGVSSNPQPVGEGAEIAFGSIEIIDAKPVDVRPLTGQSAERPAIEGFETSFNASKAASVKAVLEDVDHRCYVAMDATQFTAGRTARGGDCWGGSA